MDGPASRKRPRPRPVVSCLRCRNKKLKCDRAAPCQNCTKAACAAECTYNQHPTSNSSSTSVPRPAPKRVHLDISEEPDEQVRQNLPQSIGIIEDLQRRVVHLEELVGAQNASANFTPPGATTIQNSWPQDKPPPSTTPVQGTLVVKGSRSRYHGQNNRITLLNQFPDAKAFINQCESDSGLVLLAKEVQFLQSKSNIAANSPESLSDLESFPELQILLDSLPSEGFCSWMVKVYTTNFEKPLRIIHVPTFLRDISLLWEERSRNTPLGREFVPLLTAVLAVGAAVQVSFSSSLDDQLSLRYLKEDAPRYLDAWLKKLPRKQRTELWALQVETLLLLTRQLCAKETEELWKASGELVRSAMAMGLHIDPRESAKITPFQAECRKRLWFTIVEMDLQMSIVSGMPLMIPGLGFESLIPANLNDSDFDETTDPLPPAKGLDEETNTRFQIHLAASLPQRLKTMHMAQHSNPRDSIEMRWKQKQIMQSTLDENALWSEQFNDLGEMDSPKPALHPVITNGFLCRPLLALLQPLITGGLHDEHPLLPKIKQAVMELSVSILSSQDYFDADLALYIPTKFMDSSWEVFQTLFHQDILSAALNVCQRVRSLNESSTNQSPANDQSTLITLPGRSLSKQDLIQQVERTLDTLTRRVSAKGSNVKDILLLAVVLQSARRLGPTTQRDKLMSKGAKKALMSCRQHLISKQSGGTNPINNAPNKPEVPFSPFIPEGITARQAAAYDHISIEDLWGPASDLGDELNNFTSDLFTFDDGSFLWNL